ncbi:MAG TPA: aminotransferase class I/II-fold pyridoxal phosphate-dependent enzyme [Methylomusa anaerophila]|uniref:homocysteine desulfhydrase n=1 Tax=Methylomusa anaerophila TaxID=1930071 RepID=A0A348AIN3_9FIRM|nr:aminotransferase class I/II-fold pyridoxal phosphate-dependent enzyme [Methylomusa anaerophila]BBB90931.1 methionine gamma-lyase [Methylomusa anaerophila]HML90440.1 aminotransferase class I/II-fold pyridoxal phosphate-dependent enzyme [Methylomusa anaerophila]
MTAEQYKFDTLKVRGGYDPVQHNLAVSVPIYQTASYELGDTERVGRLFTFAEFGYLYTRIGNPTVAVLEERLTVLDGGAAAVAVGSGMAAVTYTLLNLTEGGGRVLTTPYLYGGTVDSFKKIYPKFGIAIDQVTAPDDIDAYRRAIKPDTKAIYVESISNPNAVVADIEALAQIAHEHDIPLVVDNTVATPYLLNPIKYGADIVVYSATKALSGHGNVIAGVIVEAGKFNWANGKFPHFLEPYHTLRTKEGQPRNFLEVFPGFPFSFRIRLNYLAYFGAALSPFDAYLVLLGLETLSERVNKQVASTEAVVRYLEKHRGVAWIKHPHAQTSPYRILAEKYLPKGAGSLLTFGFKGSEQQSAKFIDALKLFSYQANIGDARSLVINSPKTTHGELTPAEQAAADISSDTIRLSIGLEDPGDLIADLEQAFVKALA